VQQGARSAVPRCAYWYGVLPQRLLAALMPARRWQLLGASLARKMSVLAWEGAVARE
jgi:hypothetical protein